MSDTAESIERGAVYTRNGDDVRVLGISQNITEMTVDGEIVDTETIVSYRPAGAGEIFASSGDRKTAELDVFMEGLDNV